MGPYFTKNGSLLGPYLKDWGSLLVLEAVARGADCILVDVGMMADAWWPLPVHKGAVQLHNGGKLAKIWVMSFPS